MELGGEGVESGRATPWPWKAAAGASGAYLALSYVNVASPVLLRRFHPPAVLLLGSLALTVAFMAIHLWLVQGLSVPGIRPAAAAIGMLVSAGLVWRGLFAARLPANPLLLPWLLLALMFTAILFGVLASRIIREPALLIPAALVGAVVDYWGVFFGTTRAALQHHPQLVARLSVPVPAFAGFAPLVTIGPADFLFLGLFFACIQRFGLNLRATFAACLALLSATILLIVPRMDVPALVPIGAAVLGANWRRLRLSRSETFALLYGLALVAAILALFAWLKPYG